MWMFTEEGEPFVGDPRHALANVVKRYKDLGLTPVVATEMEFYLVDDSGSEIRQPPSPRSGKRRPGAEILSLRALDAFDAFFNDLYDACEAMDIPAEAAISEVGLGQFEINLMHVARRAEGRRRCLAVQDAGARPGAQPRHGGKLHGQTLRGLCRQRPAHAFLGQ